MVSQAKVAVVIVILVFLIASGLMFPQMWLGVAIGVGLLAFAIIVYAIRFRRPVVSTTLEISPHTFQVESGGSQILTATLGPSTASSDLIRWSLDGSGKLSSSQGASVTYFAAEKVDAESKVKIAAEFPGSAGFLNSRVFVEGVILPPGEVAMIATILTISPPSFAVRSGEKVNLTAVLTDYKGDELTGRAVKWEISPSVGRLSSDAGVSVVYTAPEMDVEVAVTIVATFEGDGKYIASSSRCMGTTTPVVLLGEYILSFDKTLMNNVEMEGPVEVDGRKVTRITAGRLDISKLGITRVNLTSLSSVFEDVEILATAFKAYSPELGKTLEVRGAETVKSGLMDSATFENGSVYFVQIKCKSCEFDKPKVVGRYIGGEEPYMPILLTASDITMERYAIEGPISYGELENNATKIRCGKITASEFALKCPIEYILDRESNTYRDTSKWVMKLSSITAEKIEMYAIYFEVKALQIWRMKATGEEYIPSVIPEGFHKGFMAPVNEANVHVVHFEADKMKVGDVVSYIAKDDG